MNEFLGINQSSEYYSAIRTSLQFKSKLWSLKLEYRRVEPNFRSMGGYFFNNDVENLTLSPGFSLFKRKVRISGSIGRQRDNILKTKLATSQKTIGNLNISVNPSQKFGMDIQYGNFGISQSAGRNPLNDTTRVNQATQNLSLMPRLMFVNTVKCHVVFLAYNLAVLNDRNTYSAPAANFTSQTCQLNYTLGLIKSKWSFIFGLTWSSFISSMTPVAGKGGNLGFSKLLFGDNLSLNWNNSLVRSESGPDKGWILNSNLGANYRVQKHHTLRLTAYFTGNYPDPGAAGTSFNEIKGDLGYVYRF
jgi:hypothetical protein